jgi:HD-GYP domain-containing protein (c-di-GMP phosphodiesterase class II)
MPTSQEWIHPEHLMSQSSDAKALLLAEKKLASLVENGLLLSREKDRDVLLRHILYGGRDIAQCAIGTLFLKTEHNTLAFAMRTNDQNLPSLELPLNLPDGTPNEKFVVTYAVNHNKTVIIDDVYSETRFDLTGTKRFSEESGIRTVSILTVPLSPRDGEVLGALQLINALHETTGEVVPFPRELIGFIEAMASQSAVALENQTLLEAQKVLINSLIKLVASAIDAKSAHTGGHCERVPELAMMLAEEAVQVADGPLAEFGFHSEEEWDEFRIGAWLHDCGKVTTPEYVVDKATKLETIYNRIHEVRMRFEVLQRDAEIAKLKSIIAGQSAAEAEAAYAACVAQLKDDFAFIAECNIGGEFIAAEKVERIRSIGKHTWMRHFDDRIGLSSAELKRHGTTPAPALPVPEWLLADKESHRIPRRSSESTLNPKFGFQVKVPKDLYNLGEIYNLSIARGTLTEEERFKINDHIIQTITMLDTLPLPRHLKRIPEYAGTHHETLIGTGYPCRLTAQELSIPSRIMAIADIFEALTASDRPYKKAKTLSESVEILSYFKRDQHIDSDLFDLFLTSGVYRRYAARFLSADQIDEVDVSRYVKK